MRTDGSDPAGLTIGVRGAVREPEVTDPDCTSITFLLPTCICMSTHPPYDTCTFQDKTRLIESGIRCSVDAVVIVNIETFDHIEIDSRK